jgi:flagellar protein FlaG
MDIRPVRDFAAASPVQQPAPAMAAHAGSTATPVETANAVRQPGSVPDTAELARAVKHINKSIETLAPGIEFSIDEQAHTTVVKVVDLKTKEVLRQMPSAETLEIAKTLDKLQGLLIKQQA